MENNMNENTKNTLNKIKEAEEAIKTAKQELEKLFKQELTELLVKYRVEPNPLKSIHMVLNNHEFNDGDATYFGLHYENLTVTFEDEIGNETEVDSYGDEKLEFKKIREEFVELFSNFDTNGFYEDVFGRFSESLDFSVGKDGSLKFD